MPKINRALYIVIGSAFNKLQEYSNPGINYLVKVSKSVDIISIDPSETCKMPADDVLDKKINLTRVRSYVRESDGTLTSDSKALFDKVVNGRYDILVMCDGISAKASSGISFSQYDKLLPIIESYLREKDRLTGDYESILFNQVSPQYSSNGVYNSLTLSSIFEEKLKLILEEKYKDSQVSSEDIDSFYNFIKDLTPEIIDDLGIQMLAKKKYPDYQIDGDEILDLYERYKIFKEKGLDLNEIYDMAIKKLSEDFFKEHNITKELLKVLYGKQRDAKGAEISFQYV